MSRSNQRRYVRRPIAVEFRIHDAESADAAQRGELLFEAVEAIDLSAGGAFLRSDLLLSAGDLVDVIFTLPGETTPLSARARVAWATPKNKEKGDAGMALEFVELSEATRAAIASFVHYEEA